MKAMCLPGFYEHVSQRVTMAPSAIEARRSGRRSVSISREMLRYRNALIRYQPATDLEIAVMLGCGVSSCCGRRGDWNATVPLDRPLVVAVDRVKRGRASQSRWAWAGQR